MRLVVGEIMKYIYKYFYIFFLLLKGSRKRPRLEKGQEAMDTDIKKEEDIKSEPKGSCIWILFPCLQINIRKKIIIKIFYLENEKDEKTNSTNEEAKKDGGANPW